jgi:hypothetical protein
VTLQKTLDEGQQWECRVGGVQVQPGAVEPLELYRQAAVVRERGGEERDFDKTRWRSRGAEWELGRESSA